jgi:hypothetical protein
MGEAEEASHRPSAQQAGIDGPASATLTHEEMPLDGEKPSVEDRRKLSEWLACGAP